MIVRLPAKYIYGQGDDYEVKTRIRRKPWVPLWIRFEQKKDVFLLLTQ